MKNKIIIILSIVIVCCLIGFLGFKLFNKKSDDFIESVQNVYASALEEHNKSGEVLFSNIYEDDQTLRIVNNDLTYMVKFNENGQIVYLVVSNGTKRFQLGSIDGEDIIKKEDLTEDKIVKDETILKPETTFTDYEVVEKSSDSDYLLRGYIIDEFDNIIITLGQKYSGSYDMNIASITKNENAEYTIVVNVSEPIGDYQIQVLSNPFIKIRFLSAVKIKNLIVKDDKGNAFEKLTNVNGEVEEVKEKEDEKIRTIIIEKKDVTPKELEELDKDSDGKITAKDIEVIKEKEEIVEEDLKCALGRYVKDKKCVLCPIDTYGSGNGKCVSCPIETCSPEGSTSIKDCKKCVKLTDPIKPVLETE